MAPKVTLAHWLDLVLRDLVDESLVQYLSIDRFFFLGFTLPLNDVDVPNGLDLHVLGKPVLVVEHLEGHVARAGVRVAILQGRVRDELRDVLLELTKVLRDVALREASMLVVGLLLGDSRVEVGLLEVEDQVLAQQLHLLELLLLIIDLRGQSDDSLPERLVVLLHIIALVVKLVSVQLAHPLVVRDLLVMLPDGLFERIVLLVQLVDIVEELHVLLLSLDERRHDLINVVDSSRLHDRLERLLDDLRVAHVLI